jgi:pilus assembly protein CpaE
VSATALLTGSPDLVERVTWASGDAVLVLPDSRVPLDAHALLEQLGGAPLPQVLLLEPGPEVDQALRLAAQLDQQVPPVSVVLVTDEGAQIGLAALRAGVRDILPLDADVAEIRAVLQRVEQAARARAVELAAAAELPPDLPAGRGGRVITVASPKGGVGKTTLATNLAIGIAKADHPTVLVDLDIQFGDVASGLGIEPEYTLVDTIRGPAAIDTMALKTFLTRHSSGLFVVCAPITPADADGITGDDIARLLKMLASVFRYVVVDTAPGLSEHTLAALDQTTDMVLVTSMDVPGVRGLRKELDTLTDLGMIGDAPNVVMNLADRSNGLSVADVEATIGRKVDVVLPVSRNVTPSVNQGIPLLMHGGGRDPMIKNLNGLVERFAPVPVAEGKRGQSKGRHRRARGGGR